MTVAGVRDLRASLFEVRGLRDPNRGRLSKRHATSRSVQPARGLGLPRTVADPRIEVHGGLTLCTGPGGVPHRSGPTLHFVSQVGPGYSRLLSGRWPAPPIHPAVARAQDGLAVARPGLTRTAPRLYPCSGSCQLRMCIKLIYQPRATSSPPRRSRLQETTTELWNAMKMMLALLANVIAGL